MDDIMRYYEIAEDAKQDLVKLQLAEKFYEDLLKAHKQKAFIQISTAQLEDNELIDDNDYDKGVHIIAFKPLDDYPDLEVQLQRPYIKPNSGAYYGHNWLHLSHLKFDDRGFTDNYDDEGNYQPHKYGPVLVVFYRSSNHYNVKEDGTRYISIENILRTKKDIIIHEFTHYLDYKRMDLDKIGSNWQKALRKGKAKNPKTGSREYFNSPVEFNAYFKAGLSNIFGNESLMSSLEKEFQSGKLTAKAFLSRAQGNWSVDTFYKDFLEAMDEKYYRKFVKRLTGLYYLLRDYYSKNTNLDLDTSEEKTILDKLLKM